MATIRARKKADGTVSYTVQIRLKKKGVLVYQYSRTFACKQAAQGWAKRRETELADPGAIDEMDWSTLCGSSVSTIVTGGRIR
ncbi:hypothetical protein KU43P_36820 [Pseudomonas sp. KU43P]|nr:hypothetical protein KU43P_36820 [Pseudomonas sp. KU43P]